MNKKWPVLLILAVAIAALFMPAVVLHVHSQLGEDVAALFPSSLSLWDVMIRGASALPLSQVPSMEAIPFGGWMAAGALLLLAASAAAALLPGKGKNGIALGAAVASLCLGAAFALHLSNLSSSLYFSMFLSRFKNMRESRQDATDSVCQLGKRREVDNALGVLSTSLC